MKMDKTYTLTLSEGEALILKKVLGNIPSNYMVEKAGITIDETGVITQIFSLLPDEDEDY